ncbi:hypothetical protein LMB58_06715 [Limosilactobacillus reuteri]|uniref:hypothetical protein n=1 Tax=Limosilactobacillus reuteri TaxID=1598 RepID=UPI001E553B4C|nr:hypothetical protein [Limosilactobacillus reuteri]MCC4328206.1 hypothetical protein [Limosilactobacillus reuteri]MCC4336473.1 hypothetical protein [Limosilactobacillus reuteri]MCC4338246.1 hypothetical protein [Limosilactobacillus reuteri]
MKINEFKNKLSSYGFSAAESVDGLLAIYLGKYPLITFNQRSSMLTEVKLNLNTVQGIDIEGLYTLLKITKEYVDTPIKERFPEKKYRLRWFDDADGSKNYIATAKGVEWALQGSGYNTFTGSELEKLKHNNPRLAPAIEAMKEPVEEEEQ